MRNLLRLLIKNHFVILFLLLQSVAVYLVVQNNNYQRAKVFAFARNISGFFYTRVNSYKEYLALRDINRELIEENATLRNELAGSWKKKNEPFKISRDSLYHRYYRFIPARVINNSINKQYNYITLNKGRLQGVKPEMGVISADGIVGVVKNVSSNFSTVISLLNRNLRVSARFKKNNYFGSLEWPGKNYQYAQLNQIPHHVDVQVGDTIVTSGYSAIFPEDVLIGFVDDFSLEGGAFYTIKVRLSNDFKKLHHVNIVDNILQKEILELENEPLDD